MSTTASTPRPPVASRTSSTQPWFEVSTAWVAPNSASRGRRSALVDVPMTVVAPISRATCSPIRPTPDEAPWIRMLRPGPQSPWVTAASCMVCSAMGRAAATSQGMLLDGTGKSRPQWTAQYSA